MLGIFLVLTPVYAANPSLRGSFADTEAFAFMEGSIGAGNLIGGLLIASSAHGWPSGGW